MDFLDPRTRVSRRRRLIASYAAMALLVVGATLVLIYSSLGYGINTKTGQIIQNGLVFVDSAPVKASITLNGKSQDKTSARLVLPTGSYTLQLSLSGYRTWQDSFKLAPQDLLSYRYALMLPVRLNPSLMADFSTTPQFISQSPDRHWLVVGSQSGSSLSLKQYDASSPQKVASSVKLPTGLAKFSGGSWQVVSWASNSSSLVLSHTLGKSREFVWVNRANPSVSFNLSALFKSPVSEVAFDGSGSSQLGVVSGGNLFTLDTSSHTVSASISAAANFASPGSNRSIYSVTQSHKIQIKIWDGGQSYTLSSFAADAKVSLAAASVGGTDYYAVASPNSVSLFANPVASLRSSPGSTLRPLVSAKLAGVDWLSFSPDGHLLIARSGSNFWAYNFDDGRAIKFRNSTLRSIPVWLDNFHLGGQNAKAQAEIFDWDGANAQSLLASQIPAGVYFSPDYHYMFSERSKTTGAELDLTNLILPTS